MIITIISLDEAHDLLDEPGLEIDAVAGEVLVVVPVSEDAPEHEGPTRAILIPDTWHVELVLLAGPVVPRVHGGREEEREGDRDEAVLGDLGGAG